jgi:hypothetical protein
MLTGILQVGQLPPQCTFWRFLTSLPVTVAQQLLKLQRLLRERVWEAANVRLPSITLDTDTTVHTLYGRQMGARKSYNPKNKGKKSYQPILTFVAETREYIGVSCATEIGPRERRLRAISRPFLPRCPVACAKLSGGLMLGSIVGMLSRRMRSTRLPSSSWRARPRVCSKS